MRPTSQLHRLAYVMGAVVLSTSVLLAVGVVDTVVMVSYKVSEKPAEGAIVEVWSKDNVLYEDRTNLDGIVKCPPLERTTKYYFKARKAGYRREYVEAVPGGLVGIKLVKKYGPPIREAK